MNRLERVREIVDRIVQRTSDVTRMRTALVHLYGVSATSVQLARLRGLDEELAGTAGMFHDLATYETGDSGNHGPRSAARARHILGTTKLFSEEEIEQITTAISRHSDKATIHGPYDELLKDADVLQHDLYNPSLPPFPGHEERRAALRERLG